MEAADSFRLTHREEGNTTMRYLPFLFILSGFLASCSRGELSSQISSISSDFSRSVPSFASEEFDDVAGNAGFSKCGKGLFVYDEISPRPSAIYTLVDGGKWDAFWWTDLSGPWFISEHARYLDLVEASNQSNIPPALDEAFFEAGLSFVAITIPCSSAFSDIDDIRQYRIEGFSYAGGKLTLSVSYVLSAKDCCSAANDIMGFTIYGAVARDISNQANSLVCSLYNRSPDADSSRLGGKTDIMAGEYAFEFSPGSRYA